MVSVKTNSFEANTLKKKTKKVKKGDDAQRILFTFMSILLNTPYRACSTSL